MRLRVEGGGGARTRGVAKPGPSQHGVAMFKGAFALGFRSGGELLQVTGCSCGVDVDLTKQERRRVVSGDDVVVSNRDDRLTVRSAFNW